MTKNFQRLRYFFNFRYLQLMKKSPKLLKKEGFSFYVEKNIDVCANFLDCECKEDFEEQLLHLHKNNCTLWKLKEYINAEVFASQLDCSIATTHRMFRRYPPLRIQSIENTLKVFDVLKRKYNFSASKVSTNLPAISILVKEKMKLWVFLYLWLYIWQYYPAASLSSSWFSF